MQYQGCRNKENPLPTAFAPQGIRTVNEKKKNPRDPVKATGKYENTEAENYQLCIRTRDRAILENWGVLENHRDRLAPNKMEEKVSFRRKQVRAI